jgi:hypothetical protein
MTAEEISNLFTEELISEIFPEDRADHFFEALYGDPSEGAYNIKLVFKEAAEDRLQFEFQLTQRPGKCLRCNLTYGLPQVFTRHPVINVKGVVNEIASRLDGRGSVTDWRLGDTIEISSELHIIPLSVAISTA